MPPKGLPRRLSVDRSTSPRTSFLNLEDDDDDEEGEDSMTTEPLHLTRLGTTPELGMEFVTIPGKQDRPLATIGPIVGSLLCLLLISLTSLAIWRRRRGERQDIVQALDKVPLSAATSEDYCPYKIESENIPTSVYAQLDQPVDGRFPKVRFGHQARLTGRVRSMCEYDEPRPATRLYAVSSKMAASARPRSCLVGLGDYDDPKFLIAVNAAGGKALNARHSMVVVNEGARELTLKGDTTPVESPPDEVYYSCLKDMESKDARHGNASPDDQRLPEPEGVYYSSINLRGQPSNNGSKDVACTSSATPQDKRDTITETQRPLYCALDRFGRKQGGRKLKESQMKGAAKTSDGEEDELVTYDYLHLTDTQQVAGAAPSTEAPVKNGPSQTAEYLQLADSHSDAPTTAQAVTRPSSAQSEPGQKSAGKAPANQSEPTAADAVYNTLQRCKRSATTARDSDDIYNVLILE